MQTPSQVASLDLEPANDPAQTEGLQRRQSLQKIVRFDLKEEGNHILAVSISYTETLIGSDAQAAGGRVRTFRKLYQFVAQPCLSVRTKSSELAPLEVENKSLGPYGKTRLLRFALEAQLENVGDGTVVVKVCVKYTSLEDIISDCKTANETQSQTAVQSHFLELGPGEAGQGRLAAAHAEPTGCAPGCILS